MTTPSPLPPAGLRCAHLVNPLGVAPDRVRFSWLLGHGSDACSGLTRFRSSRTSRGACPRKRLCWDSGQVASGESADVPYGGPPLARGAGTSGGSGSGTPPGRDVGLERTRRRSRSSSTRRTAGRRPGSGSGPVQGELHPAVAAGPVRRGRQRAAPRALPAPRRSPSARPVASARLHVTALGLYEARLNGQRVGDAFLTPGWTDYEQRVLYQTYDVTGAAARGRERARRDHRRRLVLRVRRVRRQAGRRALRHGAGTARPARHHLRRRQRRTWSSPTSSGTVGSRPHPARRPADGGEARPAARAARLGRARLRRHRLARGALPAARRSPARRRPGSAGPGHPGDRGPVTCLPRPTADATSSTSGRT